MLLQQAYTHTLFKQHAKQKPETEQHLEKITAIDNAYSVEQNVYIKKDCQ